MASDLYSKAQQMAEARTTAGGTFFLLWSPSHDCCKVTITAVLPCAYSCLRNHAGACDQFDQLHSFILHEFNSTAAVSIEKIRTYAYYEFGSPETLEKMLDEWPLDELRQRSGLATASEDECRTAIREKFAAETAELEQQGEIRMQGRIGRGLQELMRMLEVKKAKLRVEEAVQVTH